MSSTTTIETIGNGEIRDLFFREEYNTSGVFEKTFKIHADSGFVNVDFSNIGTIRKILVSVPLPAVFDTVISSANIRITVNPGLTPRYDYTIGCMGASYINLHPDYAATIEQIELSTANTAATEIDIRIYVQE
jgi:hypothetical protein